MPRFLCLWALTRQSHKELRSFCVPELETALDIVQITPSHIQAWPGTDWDNSGIGNEQLGKVGSVGRLKPKVDCQPCEVQRVMSPCREANAALAPEFDIGPNSIKYLLCTAYFEDQKTAARALQRCGLLTAIIEVRYFARLSIHYLA